MKNFFCGGVGGGGVRDFFVSLPCSQCVQKTLGIPLEQKCPHHFLIFFTMIPASTFMEPTKHQGKRNLMIKTASHFTPLNPLELKYYQNAGPSTYNLEGPLFPERPSPSVLPYI
jgi:hypothetical protein